MNWYIEVLKKYAVFAGRSRRQEYWMFVLFNFIICVVISVIEAVAGIAGPNIIYSLGVLVPSLAVSARRLHDTNRSGWLMLLGLIPIVGLIIMIVFTAQDSTPGENQYGPNPKGA